MLGQAANQPGAGTAGWCPVHRMLVFLTVWDVSGLGVKLPPVTDGAEAPELGDRAKRMPFRPWSWGGMRA